MMYFSIVKYGNSVILTSCVRLKCKPFSDLLGVESELNTELTADHYPTNS